MSRVELVRGRGREERERSSPVQCRRARSCIRHSLGIPLKRSNWHFDALYDDVEVSTGRATSIGKRVTSYSTYTGTRRHVAGTY